MPAADTKPKADLIFVHANVYTGVPDQTPFSSVLRAEAIAVKGDRILAVGKTFDLQQLKGDHTQVIDLDGHFVMPGFNDAHLHLADAGLQKLGVDVQGVKSLDEFRERVRAKVEAAKAGDWILGGGWDETLWPVKTLPTRWDLDEVSSGHPVFLVRIDGHIAVANTRALQLASITLASRDPQGGHIDRNENGEPTGILRETAQRAVQDVMPKPTHEQIRQGIELALADLAQHGVTSAQDYSPNWECFQIYEELEQEGKLTARISEWLPFDDSIDELNQKRNSHPQSDLMLHTGMIKGFMDGSLGSHTAAMLEPYTDFPKNSGLLRYEASKLNDMTKERVLAGFQIGFHAIGDKGNALVLDAYGAALKAVPEVKDARLRVEHAQVVRKDDVPRFKGLGLVASMQPSHAIDDGRWAEKELGPERIQSSYAWRLLLDHGAVLAFGSDWPVAPLDPLMGIYAAATRRTLDGKNPQGWVPQQRVTVAEALHAYTVGSAFAEHQEQIKGSLEPGKLADLAVLTDDIFRIAPTDLDKVRVYMTVFDGRVIYQQAAQRP